MARDGLGLGLWLELARVTVVARAELGLGLWLELG